MKMTKLRFVAAACAAALSLSASAAETLPAPQEWVHGFINGYFTLVAYSYAEDGNTKTPIEIQVKDKGADDSAYWTFYKGMGVSIQYTYDGARSPFNTIFKTGLNDQNNNHPLMEHVVKTNFFGTATFRMRAKDGTDTSPWVDLGDSTAYARLTGSLIGSSSVTGNGAEKVKPDNGDLQGLIDKADAWAGLDFGRLMKVRGVRYYSRGDGSYTRINGATVQYADNTAFADAVTPFTIVANNSAATPTADRRNITFLEFDEPVEARCVRMCASLGQNFSLAELEIVAAEIPYSPTVTTGISVVDSNAYPQVSWTGPTEAYPVSNRVLRATALAGPYAPVTEWTEGADGSFVDDGPDAKVSVGYYYKVEIMCDHPAFRDMPDAQLISSDPQLVYRSRRLDRDPATGALLPGVSYMSLTNGTASGVMPKAFDGNANTWPDDITLFYGPVGLKFPTNVWVSTFGYVCRSNQTSRMKMVALFSADKDDVSLDTKVQRSPRPTQVDDNGTLFYQTADSFPENGACQYFLWKCDKPTDTFHGNVAEVQFFGWTQDDIDKAGVLTPPTDVILTRLANGVRVSWSKSVAASGYNVERRLHGTDAWQVAYVGNDGSVLSYDDVNLSSGNYDYRVIAKRDGETAETSVYSVIFYVPGSGTGLKSTVFYPFKATDPLLCAPDRSHDRGVEAPALEFAAADEFAPGVVSDACLAMKGKIIVPFSGSYTFRLDTPDGGAVYVDDEWAMNGWVNGTLSDSIELAAGEHDIEVHARLESAENRVKLYWSGPVSEELVPASQLIPSDTPYTFDRGDGWKARFYGGQVRGEVYGTAADNEVVFKAGKNLAANWRTNPSIVFMAHECSTSFRLSADVTDLVVLPGSGHFGLMVRAANGNCVKCYGQDGGQSNAEAFFTVLKDGATSVDKVAQGPKFDSSGKYAMKLDYDQGSGVFAFYMKKQSDSDYTLIGNWTNDGSIPETFEVGYFVGGGDTVRNYGKVKFTNRVFREHRGLMLLVR